VEAMKRKKILILLGVFIVISILCGTSVAHNQDHNHNTNGEDDKYTQNNNNPHEDSGFPGEEQQQRSGVEW
jgi:peptidoglycan hydrolase CwlO-like protein